MCTLIVAWRTLSDAPLAVAANRDEALGRPARPPSVLDTDPAIVAPRDEEAGGTWIGYNEHGLFVAVTNRRVELEGTRSRGLLVLDALSRSSADDAVSFVRNSVRENAYAGFNLVVADAERATLFEWDGDLRATDLDPGIHVVVNSGFDGAAEKSARIRERLGVDPDETAADWLERARSALRDHDVGACVHGDDYGTRSSSLLVIGGEGGADGATYEFADGPPCRSEYHPVPDIGRVDDGPSPSEGQI